MATPRIHPTAIVDPNAQVHETCEIGPFCIVEKNVKLGPGNKLLSHVVIQNDTTVGKDNTFFPFSVIGGVPQDLKYEGENTELLIGDGNTIRESVTLNIGTKGGGGVTKVGNHNLLMAYVHLGHDTIVENNTIIGNSCQIAGHVLIEDYAIIGGVSGVSQFIRVGAHSYIGGFSGVDRDMPRFSLGRGPSPGFEIWGMNLVGLKRRGVSSDTISALQEVNRIFFKDKSTEKEVALKKIEQEVEQFPEVRQFVDFIRGSQKGVYR
jgi:UDP-N-acetylglucosamine acyltransferase